MNPIKIKNQKGDWITTNPQQTEAIEKMLLFLRSRGRDSMFFCLEGFPGTGKTTIIRHILEYHSDKMRYEKSAIVTAPTHKAKKQISMQTGFEAKTLQSILGLAPNIDVENFNVNRPEFAVVNKPGIAFYSLIVIDECSMISKDLLKMIMDQAISSSTKIIFMGDRDQLPPINEEISQVFITKTISEENRYMLTHIERQGTTNPAILLLDTMRKNMSSPFDLFEHKQNLINLDGKALGYTFLNDLHTFGSALLNHFLSKHFVKDATYVKMLCYTNNRVGYWNRAIRQSIISNRRREMDLAAQFESVHWNFLLPGEILMGYQTYKDGLTNSAEYIATIKDHVEEELEFGDASDRGLVNQLIEQSGPTSSVKVYVYKVSLQNIDTDETIECSIIDPDPKNIQKFLVAWKWYHDQGKYKRRWPFYYAWKEQYLIMVDIVNNKGDLVLRKDLDYSYAITIHKSQGSTFNSVFIDETDIDMNNNASERNRLKYVAFSRLSNKAVIYTGK